VSRTTVVFATESTVSCPSQQAIPILFFLSVSVLRPIYHYIFIFSAQAVTKSLTLLKRSSTSFYRKDKIAVGVSWLLTEKVGRFSTNLQFDHPASPFLISREFREHLFHETTYSFQDRTAVPPRPGTQEIPKAPYRLPQCTITAFTGNLTWITLKTTTEEIAFSSWSSEVVIFKFNRLEVLNHDTSWLLMVNDLGPKFRPI
jgi:hypothetical protein